jgi:hypothetical protein
MDESYEASHQRPPQSGPLSSSHVSPRSKPYSLDSKYLTPPQYYLAPPGPPGRPAGRPASLSSTFSSPQTPWTGLNKKQTKKLKKLHKEQDEYVEYQQLLMMDVSSFTLSHGRPPSKEELLMMMSRTLDRLPEYRTFSVLTNNDFEKLRSGGERGDILINEQTILNDMGNFKVPEEFWSGLQAARQVMSRVKEMGVRHVIAHFLIHATLIARQLFKEERLIVHSEYDVEKTEVPPIGIVHGPLDFVTSRAAGYLTMGEHQISNH